MSQKRHYFCKKKMRKDFLEFIYLLLEEKKLFLNPEFNRYDICSFFCNGVFPGEKIVFEEYGCSVDALISIFRVQHARKLLQEGFCYENVWKYSGFKSKRVMIKAIYRVVV